MKRFFVAFLAGLLAGMPVYAGKNDGLAIPGVGANRNTDVFQVDHTDSKVEIQLYHLRIGTGSTPDVTPGADDVFIEGTLEVDGASRFDGALTQGGAFTANGNVTLGNAATDTLTVNATTFTFSTSWLYFSTATTPGTNVMTLDGTNFRVGVNDATPDAALDVGGSFTFDGNGTFGDAGTDSLTINASTIAIPTVILAFATSTTPGRNIITLDGGNYRLGVNITTPTASLDVAGSVVLGATVTQTMDVNGMFSFASHATPDASVTPTKANQLIWNTGQTPAELCQSTGTGAGAWIVFSTRSASCSN